jgi:LysM repeat protein
MTLVIPPREGRAEQPSAAAAGGMKVVSARPVAEPRTVARARPVGGSTLSARPAASGREHIVKSGENLWTIAQHYKVDYKKLMKVNSITNAKSLQVGARLRIP